MTPSHLNPDIPSFDSLFDLEEIQEIQDSFAAATGVASIITDVDGLPITKPSNFCRLCMDIIRKTEKGLFNCMQSDRIIGRYHEQGPVIQPCLSGGLWDAGVSIHVGGKHIANWLIGQVRTPDMDMARVKEYTHTIGADPDEFAEALEEVTVMPLDQFKNISKTLFLIANRLSDQAFLAKDNARLFEGMKEELEKRIKLEENQKQMESRLRQSQKMEAVGTLAGGIAHDFNNILFPVIGFSEMILEDLPKDSPLRESMKSVLSGAFRARDLVQQILTFSRDTEQAAHPLKIQLILKEALKLARASLPSTIKIISHIPDKIGLVMADPTQIHQVAMNLITNALHAMEENGGELRVDLSEIEVEKEDIHDLGIEPGFYVCLKIADTGSGMDEQTRKRIFEPYFTTKVRGKGTGLGLAVVHGIVKKLGGEIGVKTGVGRGSEFSIYLPRIMPKGEDAAVKAMGAMPAPMNKNILVVDDEEAVLNMLDQALTRMGCRVTCQNSSLKALELVQSDPKRFDLVITDLTMPDLTGDKLISGIKKIRPDIPVILCSGFNETILNQKATGTKPDKILMKPVTKNELAEALVMLLGS